VAVGGELDRVYLESSGDCLVDDPGLNRRIRIGKRGSRSTIVWNPWAEKAEKLGDMGEDGYLGMVCVESANAADDVVSLAPGAEHSLRVEYSLEALPRG
jgi:glucose-6-phosphate 1-epimerase